MTEHRRATHYRLNEDHTVEPVSVAGALDSWSMKNRRVAVDEVGDVRVSTVFLVIDHAYSNDGPPILFETMVFRGETGEECERCSTYDEAVEQHAQWCRHVFGADYVVGSSGASDSNRAKTKRP